MDGAMSIKSWEASSYCIGQCHAALRSGRNGEEGGGQRHRWSIAGTKGRAQTIPASREWAVNSDTFYEGGKWRGSDSRSKMQRKVNDSNENKGASRAVDEKRTVKAELERERERERANGKREERNAAKRSRDEILIHGSGAALNRKCSRLATARQAVASGSPANHVTSKRDVWNKPDILESWMIFWRQIRLLL